MALELEEIALNPSFINYFLGHSVQYFYFYQFILSTVILIVINIGATGKVGDFFSDFFSFLIYVELKLGLLNGDEFLDSKLQNSL